MKKDVMSLKDVLSLNRDRIVFIGARSSFFFIGPASEAEADLALICAMMRRLAYLTKKRTHRRISMSESDGYLLGQRRVLETYEHDGGLVILIEGKEFGMFWTRKEYLTERKKLLCSLEG